MGIYTELDASTKPVKCRFLFYCDDGEHYTDIVRSWMNEQGFYNASDAKGYSANVFEYDGRKDCWFNSHYFVTDDADIAFAFKMRWC